MIKILVLIHKRGKKMVILELNPLVAGELYYQVCARLDYFEDLLKSEAYKGYERIKQITTVIERLKIVQSELLNSRDIKFDR
jgi:hypothetical protein